ncbi:MAG: hypothetical protein ACKOPK_22865, partial [Dolichospermum sp.]
STSKESDIEASEETDVEGGETDDDIDSETEYNYIKHNKLTHLDDHLHDHQYSKMNKTSLVR